MLNHLLQSVFSQSAVVVSPLMLFWSALVSLFLGGLLSALYRYKTSYSKEFAVTLVVLPTLIATIIFLVNGNLGTSVAVAGAFSLIKFRSPASSSKELLLVFMATAVGLATGMGYLTLATVLTLLVSAVLVFLEQLAFRGRSGHWHQVKVRFPASPDHQQQLSSLLNHLGQTSQLETVKVKQGELDLTYLVLSNWSDQDLLQQLLAVDKTWTVTVERSIKKKKAL